MSFTRKELAELKPSFLDRMYLIGSVTTVAREMGINLNTARMWAYQAGLKSRRVPHPRKAEYLELRRAGFPQTIAARKVGGVC